jgi:hypothetical protein
MRCGVEGGAKRVEGVKATKGLGGAKRELGVDGIGTYARLQAEGGAAAPARPFESREPMASNARMQAATFSVAEPTVGRDTRIDWATVLKRVHDIDALACPRGGRLRGAA